MESACAAQKRAEVAGWGVLSRVTGRRHRQGQWRRREAASSYCLHFNSYG
jgi:hypothetical protein